jgi:hypothetical protein
MKLFILIGINALNGNVLLLMVDLHASKKERSSVDLLLECFVFHVVGGT